MIEAGGGAVMSESTIYALSSGGGRAGVAVFRISGDGCRDAWKRLTDKPEPEPRRMILARFGLDGEMIDEGLGVLFAKPNSYTGEDILEIHVHGGRAVIEGILRALAACPGLRPAEPGEFTRRAFEHGKMDLTEAEAVMDLIDAETESQHRQALRQKEGVFGQICEKWRDAAIHILGLVEAAIDFSDEGLGDGLVREARTEAGNLRDDIAGYLSRGERGRKIREGFYVAIVGEPNVGKSSLLNRLARRDAAIVSETAGTTRDVVEVRMSLGGFAVTFADTAGLRETSEDVEEEGIRRARAAAERADLRLMVLDVRRVGSVGDMGETAENTIVVANKSDLAGGGIGIKGALSISAKTGYGLDALESEIVRRIGELWRGGDDDVVWTRERHRAAMAGAIEAFDAFLEQDDEELAAEEARRAVVELGKIVGKVGVEDVLDRIFRDFCIGK